jgi:nucleotide-binding universal stress UspA family protein
MTVHHILVPIDFSTYAEQALDYAITLGKQLQARVTLLHVIQPPLVAGADMGAWPSQTYIEELEAAITSDLEGYLARVTTAGLQGEMVVVHGTPFQEIINTAKARQVDLIVMGTHGRTGLTHVLLGSVAERVVRQAPCPVLVVRQPAPVAAS